MKELVIRDVRKRVSLVRELILQAGNRFCSVHFRKREDGSKRRMCCRLHTKKPTYSKVPNSNGSKKRQDFKNDLLTVFDTNKVLYNKKGKMNGRGAWRSIPLESVERVKVGGEIYRIKN